MMPHLLDRQNWCGAMAPLLAALAAIGGCTLPVVDQDRNENAKTLAEVTAEPAEEEGPRLIRHFASPWNTNYVKIDGVALVTGLSGTGSDPPPSSQRAALLDEMETHEVRNPNQVLASPDTALVLVRAFLPPGVQKGDRIDVEVSAPPRSETTSLRGGWMMRSRLREMAVLDNRLRSGRVDALAQGPVIVDSMFQTDDEVHRTRGRVLGGGVAMTSRPLGLAVRSEKHSIKTASLIGVAINERFHTYDRGIKKGVATPKRDNFVELEVHPRYKHNVARFIAVIRNLALKESPTKRIARIELLSKKLHEPTTCSLAALQLEAIGRDALPVLRGAVTAADPEVRFYAAESLAYLDEPDATDVLAAAAVDEPAFRWHAIAALAAMEHARSYDALTQLLHVSSAETRYAAFRALKKRNPLDPLVHGELLDDKFHYHPLPSDGSPMIHFARTVSPEIVVFGHDQRMLPPAFLYAGDRIMLKEAGADRIKVIRFAAGEENREEICGTDLDDVIRTIVRMGGGYLEVLGAMQEAKRRGYIEARVVIDALPRAGREFRRRDDHAEDQDGAEGEDGVMALADAKARSPLPDMFHSALSMNDDSGDNRAAGNYDINAAPEVKPGFFERVGGWFKSERN